MDHHDTNSGEGMLIAHQMGKLRCQPHNCSVHSKKKEEELGGWFCCSECVIHLPFVYVHYSIYTLSSPIPSASHAQGPCWSVESWSVSAAPTATLPHSKLPYSFSFYGCFPAKAEHTGRMPAHILELLMSVCTVHIQPPQGCSDTVRWRGVGHFVSDLTSVSSIYWSDLGDNDMTNLNKSPLYGVEVIITWGDRTSETAAGLPVK